MSENDDNLFSMASAAAITVRSRFRSAEEYRA